MCVISFMPTKTHSQVVVLQQVVMPQGRKGEIFETFCETRHSLSAIIKIDREMLNRCFFKASLKQKVLDFDADVAPSSGNISVFMWRHLLAQ